MIVDRGSHLEACPRGAMIESIRPLQAERVSRGMGPCGHLIFSPNGKQMLADTYSVDGKQTLSLVNSASGDLQETGKFRHEQPEHYPEDVRCDLHPRWSSDCSMISVDSIDDGLRGIYCYKCDCANEV